MDKQWFELQKELEEEKEKRIFLEKELEFYKAAINALPNPVFLKDQELRYVFFNESYKKYFGLSDNENIGKKVEDLSYLSAEEKDRFKSEDVRMRDELSVIQYEVDFEEAEEGKKECLYWSKGFQSEETKVRGVIGEIVDISSQKKIQRELNESMASLKILMRDAKNASNTDPLTKLYNRNILEEEIPGFINNTKKMGQPISMLLIDIDYFKQINDKLGHLYGDEILTKFGNTLRKTFRQKDISIRYGGDEFMILLPGCEVEEAENIANRFRYAVCENLDLENGFCVTLSIGITACHPKDDLESFIARADEALYQAKRAGRNRAVAIK